MTSSTKPEIHNFATHSPEKLAKFDDAIPKVCERTERQTDRQTNTLIAMLYSPTVVVGFAFTAQPHSTVLSGKSFPLPTPA